jgi:hypothetical protein
LPTHIKVTKDTASGALKTLQAELESQRAIATVLEEARSLIFMRTLQGQDMHGASFQAYSSRTYYAPLGDKRPEGYPKPKGGRSTHKKNKKKKLKSMVYEAGYGQYKQGIGRPATVQLSVSGQMLGDMATRVINNHKGEIFFTSRQSAAKAHGHHTGANALPKREFFGLSSPNVEALRQELVGVIREVKKTAGLS